MPIINSVISGGGTTPTGTKNITSNGTHNVADYEYADVNVPTTAPALYREFELRNGGGLYPSATTTNIMSFSGVKFISSAYILYAAYVNNTAISGTVDMSDLEKFESGPSACTSTFNGCTGITSVDLSKLKTIISSVDCCRNMFYNCRGLTSIDLSSLSLIKSSSNAFREAFNNCSSLTGTIDLSSLATITDSTQDAFYNAFFGCTGITGINLNSLTYVGGANTSSGKNAFYGTFTDCSNLTNVNISHLFALMPATAQLNYTFRNCTSLSTLSFNSLAYTDTNLNTVFTNMLSGCSGVTVHFPAEWQTAMSSWSSVTSGFGGTNTTVLFDLPNVTTLDLTYITSITASEQEIFASMVKTRYPNVTKVDLKNLTSVAGNRAFNYMCLNDTSLTSVDMSALKTIDAEGACQYMFDGCTGITGTIDLGALETIGHAYGPVAVCQGMFRGCTSVTGVDLHSLKNIYGAYACQYMFSGCTSLTGAIVFDALEQISNDYLIINKMFENTAITSVSFPSLKTAQESVFSGLLVGTSNVTVHFPSNFSTTVSAATLDGTGTTVLYDLPAIA